MVPHLLLFSSNCSFEKMKLLLLVLMMMIIGALVTIFSYLDLSSSFFIFVINIHYSILQSIIILLYVINILYL